MIKRREFFGWVGIGWLASFLPLALASCNQQTSQNPSTNNTNTFEAVGSLADLNKQGFLDRKFSEGSVVIIKDSTNPNQLIALNPTCTHAGCTVAWNRDEKAFLCPCHDSKFAEDGQVIKGPAKDPLAVYAVKVEGDKILVKAG